MHTTDTSDSVSGLQPLQLNPELETIPVNGFHGVKVYTRASYLKAMEKVDLAFDKTLMSISVSRKVYFSKDVAIIIPRKLGEYVITAPSLIAPYIAFVLNTNFGKIGLLNDDKSGNQVTNSRAIGRTMIPRPSDETILYCCTLENLIRFLNNIIDSMEVVPSSVRAVKSLLSNIREYIVMEMIAPDFFSSRDIHILDSWEEVVNYFSRENMEAINENNPDKSMELTMALFDKCLEFGNPLMQNLNKMKAYISDLRLHFEHLQR